MESSCALAQRGSDKTRDYKFQTWLGEHISEVGPFVGRLLMNLENNEV
jgi:hypothetical protein